MSVSAITRAAASYVQQVTGGSTSQNPQAAATQEASETAATTKQEAAHGDQAAVRKLAKLQATQEAENPTAAQESATERGKGEGVDTKA